jgi:hypothetical protein
VLCVVLVLVLSVVHGHAVMSSLVTAFMRAFVLATLTA